MQCRAFHRWRCAAATLLIFLVSPIPNHQLSVTRAAQSDAQPAERALLVLLDVSGSMREPVRGGIKNDLAVRGLTRTLAALPSTTLVGLRLMGEGGAGSDCGATRTAIAMTPFAPSAWDTALARVNWKGSTPIAHSTRAALEDLRRVNAARKDILIIGDGDETCGEDPVGVARAESGGIRIHGISLGEEVSHELAGIALVTGGTYARAFDAEGFAAAVGNAVPAAPTPAAGQAGRRAGPSRVEIILDVSNSMSGRVNGTAKIELAREALGRALAQLRADIPVGLRAYGHRVPVAQKDAGCEDTERLLAPAPGNGPAIIARANALVPRGHTPIARSLHEAGADLAREGAAGVIVLVSDGVESCGGDPEAVARGLRASGLDVILHTVGVGVGSGDAAALSALAAAGGGQYFNAPEAADVAGRMGEALQSGQTFVLRQDRVELFPRDIVRVAGGATAGEAETIGPGTYSFTDHLFRTARYFAVAGRAGTTVTVSGLVCALELGRTRAGAPVFQGSPNMMIAERVAANGRRLAGASLIVRGDMGTWVSFDVTVGADGFARFRIGRPQGAVNRDMVFRIVAPARSVW